MFNIKAAMNYGILWRHVYAPNENKRACACVYLSQHLDGSLMTLTFRGGRGRMKKQRVKKLLSNFVARVLPKTQSSFPYSLWHLFFLFMFQVSLYSTSMWSMRFAFRSAGVKIYDLCAINAVEAIVSITRSSFFANAIPIVPNSRSEIITINSIDE